MPVNWRRPTLLACIGILVLLIRASAFSQANDEPPDHELSPELASNLLHQAITQLEARSWVSARMRQDVQLFGQRLRGEGLYWQGPQLQMRSEIRTRLPRSRKTAVLLQVCDGQILWQYRDLADQRELNWIDAQRVVRAWNQAQHEGRTIEPGVRFLGIGGLPQLLRTLADDVRFEQLATLADPQGSAGDFVLIGRWRPETLVRMLPPNRRPTEGQRPQARNLPEHLPDRVEIRLRRSDLFPVAIRWARMDRGEALPAPPDGQGPPPRNDAGKTLMRIEFHDITLDKPLPAEGFRYRPGPRIPTRNITEEYLGRQGLGGLGNE